CLVLILVLVPCLANRIPIRIGDIRIDWTFMEEEILRGFVYRLFQEGRPGSEILYGSGKMLFDIKEIFVKAGGAFLHETAFFWIGEKSKLFGSDRSSGNRTLQLSEPVQMSACCIREHKISGKLMVDHGGYTKDPVGTIADE